MATITLTLSSTCAGGGHQTFVVTGAFSRTMNTTIDLDEPMSAEERESFVKGLVKLVKMGRTNAQARTLLQAGVTVVV